MLWDRVGLGVVGWGGGKRWDSHTWYKHPYPSSLIMNSSDRQQFLRWGTSRSAQMDSQFLRNLIFTPLTKVASAHPSINYFQIFLCHDRWDFQPSINMKISRKCKKKKIFGRLLKSVNILETLGSPLCFYIRSYLESHAEALNWMSKCTEFDLRTIAIVRNWFFNAIYPNVILIIIVVTPFLYLFLLLYLFGLCERGCSLMIISKLLSTGALCYTNTF